MIHNRSVPTNQVLPHLYYENVAEALTWVNQTFGFQEHFRFELPNGQLHGAMIYLGDVWVMLKSIDQLTASPIKLGAATQSLMLFVTDIEEHYNHSKTAGARIVEELFETEYGERQYAAVDIENHLWLFSQHVKDVDPTAWGATLAARS
ncbi:VOC family protein [Paenibacillus sp. CF384]|uniref:VOC family protein n=1 Tax=Paenibacillus sp. CF384 TaxID=1884382 RepID=UPI00089C26F5|nr:VOC family protein [Paenibacillus sp. CF384]SDX58079.1 Uncharacterized conserved protein PhnB, glyoxalase superfamily [Paenibacillus sp. CF384]